MELDRSARMCIMAAFSDVQGLKRKLSSKLSVVGGGGHADAEEDEDDWQVTLVQAEENFLNTLFNSISCKPAS